ncbi:tetratricopeptide repeat protein [Telmatospirillum sp.]|uniref:tetratricopeptide repeat-containing sulfotransferase family protein n=1 Tax=Telmatospirillum sp. TaxID=2079197 RepID=UPI00284588C7|nr:tetratricopeptide repeat protein [Telmatospirillum sp.]MDR3439750.1 tetratricopeptide repeat protein [Telmatospirillum sp.]
MGKHKHQDSRAVRFVGRGPTDVTLKAFEEALALHRQNRLDEAAEGYEAILGTYPNHVPSLCCLSLCRLNDGMFTEALRLGHRAARLASQSAEVWYSLGNAQAATGAHRDAAASFRKMLAIRPMQAEGHGNLGKALTALGQPEKALLSFAKALVLEPGSIQTLLNYGNVLTTLGRPDEAVGWFARAVACQPNVAEASANLGAALHWLGRSREALAPLRNALRWKPEDGEVQFTLGNVLQSLNRSQEAIPCYRNAIALGPNSAAAYANLGTVLKILERIEPAIDVINRAMVLAPNSAQIHNNLGNALEAETRFDEAIVRYRKTLDLDPTCATAYYGLGNCLSALKRHGRAIDYYIAAITLQPDFADAYNNLGIALQALGRFSEAIGPYRKSIILEPEFAKPWNNLGSDLQALDRNDAATACYRRAIALLPDYADAYCNMGIALEEIGNIDETCVAFERAVDLAPRRGYFYRTLADTGRIETTSPHLRHMEDLMREGASLPENERMELHFALAKVYGDTTEHARSFYHLLAGNRLKRQSIDYDEARTLALLDRIRSVFTADLLAAGSDLGASSGLPVFIVGMPRSGTTLVEQILASHPQVFGAGELTDLRDLVKKQEPVDGIAAFPEIAAVLSPERLRRLGNAYVDGLQARAPSATRIVDKMLDNFKRIGLIHLILPQARIIHVRRDPVDTCLACFSKLFAGHQSYAYDLAELGRYYRAYDRLMEHWRLTLPAGVMLEVHYEDVVADMENQTARILAHCGLPWDDRCLSFHLTRRLVRTASATQVRRPLYSSSVGRWHIYGHLAGPLFEALNLKR